MAAPDNEFQAAVKGLLEASVELSALVEGRIFDRIPSQNTRFPYITFGPSDEVDAEADCIEGGSYSLQIDVWSEYQGGFAELKEITYAVKKALNGVNVDLPTHALITMQVPLRKHMRDPDGESSHGVVQVEAEIEER